MQSGPRNNSKSTHFWIEITFLRDIFVALHGVEGFEIFMTFFLRKFQYLYCFYYLLVKHYPEWMHVMLNMQNN